MWLKPLGTQVMNHCCFLVYTTANIIMVPSSVVLWRSVSGHVMSTDAESRSWLDKR